MNSTPQAGHPAILRVFQTKDQTRAFYNKISHVYDLLSERSEAPMRKTGLDLIKPNAGESLLEIGFGTGHTLVSLAQAVGPKGKVFGLDLSDQMAKLAKRIWPNLDCLNAPRSVVATRRSFLTRQQHGRGVYELHTGVV